MKFGIESLDFLINDFLIVARPVQPCLILEDLVHIECAIKMEFLFAVMVAMHYLFVKVFKLM